MNEKFENPKYSFQDLFVVYSKFGKTYSDGKTISLIQSDKWMKTAGLFKERSILSLCDTLVVFVGFKKKNLNYYAYREFIKKVCISKKLDLEVVKQKLQNAGLPKWQCYDKSLDASIFFSKHGKKKKKKTSNFEEGDD